MERRVHVAIGLFCSVPFIYLQYRFGFMENAVQQGFCYLAASFFGSRMPDLMDKPIDYKHRKAFHSKELLSILLIPLVASGMLSFMLLTTKIASYAFYFLLGYYLHLVADSTTTMGLPSNKKLKRFLEFF